MWQRSYANILMWITKPSSQFFVEFYEFAVAFVDLVDWLIILSNLETVYDAGVTLAWYAGWYCWFYARQPIQVYGLLCEWGTDILEAEET
jgi:hypothetical protein